MEKKIIVLGAGMVGSAIAKDLSKSYKVVVADLNEERLSKLHPLETLVLNVTLEHDLEKAIFDFDLVVCAVPGFLGFKTLKRIIESKKDVVDISFCPEDTLVLNQVALNNNVTAVVDCGVAPGLDNIILGITNQEMVVTHFECMVGGLPKTKKWPFYYKAPFSPVDVIEEYSREARYVENGHIITKPAMSDCEFIEIPSIGTLEAFNTDGLRTLLFTMSHIPNMKEKTLRYPGHIQYVKALKESGFFNENKIDIKGFQISPLEFTSKILFDEWKLNEDEEELTVMTVKISGTSFDGVKRNVFYFIYDEFDKATKVSSMARTTGYTAAATADYILKNGFQKGVIAPEFIGSNRKFFEHLMDYLKQRNIKISCSVQ